MKREQDKRRSPSRLRVILREREEARERDRVKKEEPGGEEVAQEGMPIEAMLES